MESGEAGEREGQRAGAATAAATDRGRAGATSQGTRRKAASRAGAEGRPAASKALDRAPHNEAVTISDAHVEKGRSSGGEFVYAEYIRDLVELQDRYKSSMEQRAGSVITTSSTLAALLFGFASVRRPCFAGQSVPSWPRSPRWEPRSSRSFCS